MNKVDLHISKKFKQFRQEKNLSTIEMAKLLGMKSHVSVTRMEQGQQSFTTKTIYLACSIFDKTPNDIFPSVKKANVIKQKREVVIKPKIFKVSGLPKV